MRKKTAPLTARQVSDFLLQHPDFFIEHSDLLADLQLPSQTGAAISLMDRQAKAMRERNSELRQRLGQLVTVARDNERLFGLIRTLGLALLEATQLTDLTRVLHHALTRDFGNDCARLFLFDAIDMPSNAFLSVCSKADMQERLGSLVPDQKIVCGALRQDELVYLFPGTEATAGSVVLIPLHYQRPVGILAVGSHDPGHFSAGMETLFVDYIGEVVARRLSHFLPAG